MLFIYAVSLIMQDIACRLIWNITFSVLMYSALFLRWMHKIHKIMLCHHKYFGILLVHSNYTCPIFLVLWLSPWGHSGTKSIQESIHRSKCIFGIQNEWVLNDVLFAEKVLSEPEGYWPLVLVAGSCAVRGGSPNAMSTLELFWEKWTKNATNGNIWAKMGKTNSFWHWNKLMDLYIAL